MERPTMIDAFDEEQQQEIIESVARHALGSEQFVKIAKLSGELGDRGLSVEKILGDIMNKIEKGSYQGITMK